MALSGISFPEHNRLLDKLNRRTDQPAVAPARYESLVELYHKYEGLIAELERVIGTYEEVAVLVRSRRLPEKKTTVPVG